MPPPTLRCQLTLYEPRLEAEEGRVIVFADITAELENGDDLSACIHQMVAELARTITCNWDPNNPKRVIIGPPPLRVVKG
jgi:hypothetical protein